MGRKAPGYRVSIKNEEVIGEKTLEKILLDWYLELAKTQIECLSKEEKKRLLEKLGSVRH